MKSIQTSYGEIEFPCFNVQFVPMDKVRASCYSQNHVPAHYMELLLESVIQNGFCFPVVVIYDSDDDIYTIIDGEQRYILFKDYFKANEIPVVVLKHDASQQMTATMQFNKARDVHKQCRQEILVDSENNLPVKNDEDPIVKQIKYLRSVL